MTHSRSRSAFLIVARLGCCTELGDDGLAEGDDLRRVLIGWLYGEKTEGIEDEALSSGLSYWMSIAPDCDRFASRVCPLEITKASTC